MPKSLTEILTQLDDIDGHMERLSARTSPGSDLNEIAYAIHNVIICIKDLRDLDASLL